MKHKLSLLFSLVALAGVETIRAQSPMFRYTPEHTAAVTSPASGPLTSLYGKFSADGPIRATVSSDGTALYVGTANGTFFSLNPGTGGVNWRLQTGEAIHSSAAIDKATVYFTNNRQTLYAVSKSTGQIRWQRSFSRALPYPWAFDYFYSSPTLTGTNLVVGISDGFVYNLSPATGEIRWKYKTEGIVRSTAAVKDGLLYFGGTDGTLYALQLADGKEVWKFRTEGYRLRNEDFGFDRKAIISSPVVAGDNLFFGGRDGFLYAVHRKTGTEKWRVNHNVSWVISSPAVKDSIVVTGTSDGRFVQAVNSETGREIWRYKTAGIVWSSPLICNRQVYIGSNEGQLYCLDLQTGRRLSSFQTDGKIWSSPVVHDTLLLIGTDKGSLYALKPSRYPHPQSLLARKAVFYEPAINGFGKKSIEQKTNELLTANGFAALTTNKLATWLNNDSANGSVVVFATGYFPAEITRGNRESLLANYLSRGGRVVLLGLNPALYVRDTATNAIVNFNFAGPDSVLGIRYPFNDLRSMKGTQPAFATTEGKQWGLPGFWTGFLPLTPSQVDLVLGYDENHLASAWVKYYNTAKTGGLVQLWTDQENESDLNFVLWVAEHELP